MNRDIEDDVAEPPRHYIDEEVLTHSRRDMIRIQHPGGRLLTETGTEHVHVEGLRCVRLRDREIQSLFEGCIADDKEANPFALHEERRECVPSSMVVNEE